MEDDTVGPVTIPGEVGMIKQQYVNHQEDISGEKVSQLRTPRDCLTKRNSDHNTTDMRERKRFEFQIPHP